MRILSCSQRPLGQGGMETVMAAIDSTLSSRGYEVVTCLMGPSVNRSWESSLSKVVLGPARDVIRVSSLWQLIPVSRWLRHILKTLKPDIVIAHDAATGLLVYLMGMRPTVVYEHGLVSELSAQSFLFNRVYNIGLRSASLIVCGGKDYGDALNQQLGVKAVPIGIPVEFPPTTIARPSEHTKIIYVGRLENAQKRVDRLLHACATLPSRTRWNLQLIGDGPHRSQLMALARELNVADHCEWSGWLQQPWSAVKDASFLAFPSDHEGFGAVILEAMARGIPVLSTDCDFGPRTVIHEGVNGWLVPVNDVAFANKLQDVVLGRVKIPGPIDVRNSVSQHTRWGDNLGNILEKIHALSASDRDVRPNFQ